jgi:hypothetical protein
VTSDALGNEQHRTDDKRPCQGSLIHSIIPSSVSFIVSQQFKTWKINMKIVHSTQMFAVYHRARSLEELSNLGASYGNCFLSRRVVLGEACDERQLSADATNPSFKN